MNRVPVLASFPLPAGGRMLSRRADRVILVSNDDHPAAALVLRLDLDPRADFPDDGAALHVDINAAAARRLARSLRRYARSKSVCLQETKS